MRPKKNSYQKKQKRCHMQCELAVFVLYARTVCSVKRNTKKQRVTQKSTRGAICQVSPPISGVCTRWCVPTRYNNFGSKGRCLPDQNGPVLRPYLLEAPLALGVRPRVVDPQGSVLSHQSESRTPLVLTVGTVTRRVPSQGGGAAPSPQIELPPARRQPSGVGFSHPRHSWPDATVASLAFAKPFLTVVPARQGSVLLHTAERQCRQAVSTPVLYRPPRAFGVFPQHHVRPKMLCRWISGTPTRTPRPGSPPTASTGLEGTTAWSTGTPCVRWRCRFARPHRGPGMLPPRSPLSSARVANEGPQSGRCCGAWRYQRGKRPCGRRSIGPRAHARGVHEWATRWVHGTPSRERFFAAGTRAPHKLPAGPPSRVLLLRNCR